MTSLARCALIVATIAAVLTATRARAHAWGCNAYYDTTAFPQWEPVSSGCSMFVLEEYARYEASAVELEAYLDDAWVVVDATIERELIQMTLYLSACNDSDSCETESWQTDSEYALYTITPTAPPPDGTELRAMVLDSVDSRVEIAAFTTGEGATCMEATDIPDPWCAGAPCEYEYPEECGDGAYPNPYDDDDDDGHFSGCNSGGGSGSGLGGALLVLLVVARRPRN